MKIIHISDLHFHKESYQNQDIFSKLNKIQNKYFQDRENYLLVTGDITDDGHIEQYNWATNCLSLFGKENILVCPGNHDIGFSGVCYSKRRAERFDKQFTNYLDYTNNFFPKSAPIVNIINDSDGYEIITIGINAVLETINPFDFSRGEVGEGQLANLQEILNDSAIKNLPKIVYLHFNPFMHDETMELKDAQQFLDVLRDKVDILCFGHQHRQRIYPLNLTEDYGIPTISEAGSLIYLDKVIEITFNRGKFVEIKESLL